MTIDAERHLRPAHRPRVAAGPCSAVLSSAEPAVPPARPTWATSRAAGAGERNDRDCRARAFHPACRTCSRCRRPSCEAVRAPQPPGPTGRHRARVSSRSLRQALEAEASQGGYRPVPQFASSDRCRRCWLTDLGPAIDPAWARKRRYSQAGRALRVQGKGRPDIASRLISGRRRCGFRRRDTARGRPAKPRRRGHARPAAAPGAAACTAMAKPQAPSPLPLSARSLAPDQRRRRPRAARHRHTTSRISFSGGFADPPCPAAHECRSRSHPPSLPRCHRAVSSTATGAAMVTSGRLGSCGKFQRSIQLGRRQRLLAAFAFSSSAAVRFALACARACRDTRASRKPRASTASGGCGMNAMPIFLQCVRRQCRSARARA